MYRALAYRNYACIRIQKLIRTFLLFRRFRRRFYNTRATRIQRKFVIWNTIRKLRWGVRRIKLDNWAATKIIMHMRRVIKRIRLRLRSIALIKKKMRGYVLEMFCKTNVLVINVYVYVYVSIYVYNRYAKRMQCVRQSRLVRNIIMKQTMFVYELTIHRWKYRVERYIIKYQYNVMYIPHNYGIVT